MAWTATVTSKSELPGASSVNVTYSNGSSSFEKVYSINSGECDATWLKRQAIAEIKRLEAIESKLPSLEIGPIDVTSLPDVQKSELEQWLSDYRKILIIAPLIESGILTGSETFVVAQKNKVKSGWKSGYWDFM